MPKVYLSRLLVAKKLGRNKLVYSHDRTEAAEVCILRLYVMNDKTQNGEYDYIYGKSYENTPKVNSGC